MKIKCKTELPPFHTTPHVCHSSSWTWVFCHRLDKEDDQLFSR